MNRRLRCVIAVGALALTAQTACAAPPEQTSPITVYAASSLIKSFTTIGKEFEAVNPGYSVEFVFAGSTELSSAIADGVDADVYASGDQLAMKAVSDAGAAAGEPVPFAANRLVIITAAGNPRRLRTLADLTQPGLRVAVCADQNMCGAVTRRAQDDSGVRLHPQSTESTPGNVLKAVTSGQADAGVAFATDALAGGDSVSWFALPGDANAVTSLITVVNGTDREREAALFVEMVTGEDGRRILSENGFVQPTKIPAG